MNRVQMEAPREESLHGDLKTKKTKNKITLFADDPA